MKKVFLSALLMMALSVSTFASDERTADKEVKVTSRIIGKFDADFSAAENVTWSVVGNLYKATFTLNGEKSSAFYDWENTLIATTSPVKKDVLSAKAVAWMAKNYKDYEISQVIKHFDGTTNYFVDLKKANKEVIVRVSGDQAFFFKRIN